MTVARKLAVIAIATSAFAVSGCASVRTSTTRESVPVLGILSGMWEGSFIAESPTLNCTSIPSTIVLRLVLEQGAARVFVNEESTWKEIEPRRFKVEVLGTNALIYIVHAGKIPTAVGSRWFETYLVAATAQNKEKLLIRWLRVVTNIDVSPDDPDRSFTVDGEGILTKVQLKSGG